MLFRMLLIGTKEEMNNIGSKLQRKYIITYFWILCKGEQNSIKIEFRVVWFV